MNKFLQKLVDNHPRLGCTLYSLKHSKDPEYITRAMKTDPFIMRCVELGELNPNINIYFLEMGDKGDGFFAEYCKALKYLHYADRFNMIPVISFTQDFMYAEDHPVNGSDNPFEYYFEEPCGISVEEAMQSRNVFLAEYIHTQTKEILGKKESDYQVSPSYVRMMGRVAHKYIRVKPIVKENIDSEKTILQKAADVCLNDRTIGIHFRGTDFKRNLDKHPVYTDIEEYIDSATDLLDSGEFDNIFLATDDLEAVERFKKTFRNRVLSYDNTVRSAGNTSVAFSHDTRYNHKYLLGFEVLRDMYTLTECGALIAGVSQVALAARITKLSKGDAYRKIKIIDHDVNNNNRDSQKYYRKAEKR